MDDHLLVVERRILVRDDAYLPARRVGLAALRWQGQHLGRSAILSPLAEGARFEHLPGGRFEHRSAGTRAPGPARRDRDPAPGERVDPQVDAQLLSFSRNGVSRSIGAGKTMVVDAEEPSSTSVCRYRSCRPIGWSSITSAASFSRSEAWNSPSAA